MPDREQVIKELRAYYEWTAGADWSDTTLAQACKDGANLLEDDQKRIEVLENTIAELNRELEEVKGSDNREMAKPRRSRRLCAESSSRNA